MVVQSTKDNTLKELENILISKNEFVSSSLKEFYLFTVNHKTAPVSVREKFAIPEHKLQDAVKALKESCSINSFLILSTCNRTEIYFKTNNYSQSINDVNNFFISYLGIEKKTVKEYSFVLNTNQAINHSFRVASGLDSLVIGESQVLSQVKAAYTVAQKESTLHSMLEILFQNVLNTAKEVHKNTNISKNCQSISSAAIDLANKIAGPLKTKQIMVLGAGKMAELALEHIVKLGGSKETIALNRSPHRVIEFSEKYKIDSSVPFEDVYKAMNNVDIVITATGAPHFILFADQFNNVRKDPEKPLFIFDISMPRNVDEEFTKLPNVKVMDIDSLQLIYNEITKTNIEDIKNAESIISSGINSFYKEISKETVSTIIKELKDRVENIRQEKLKQLTSSKSSFTPEEVDYITKNILNTLLHGPINSLKNSATNGLTNEKIEILKDLFDLI